MAHEALLLNIDEAGQRLSIGRTLLLNLLYRGEIGSVKVGRRRLIPTAEITKYVERLTQASTPDARG